MTEQAAKTPSGANAPYKIVQISKNKWAVKNNTGDTKATFGSYSKALAYQRALYANVKGAPKRADKVPYSGKAKDRVAAAVPEPHPFIKAMGNVSQAPPLKEDKGNGGLTRQVIDTNPDCVVCGMKEQNPIHNSSHPSNVSPPPMGEDEASRKLSELADFPKTQKCKFCSEQATKRVIHSEGMAYVPACDEHLGKAKDAAARCTPDGSSDPSNIDYVRDVAGFMRETTDVEIAGHSGVMVALFPPDDVAQDMAIPGGEDADELHVTLAFLGKADQLSEDDVNRLKAIVEGWAHTVSALDATVAGVGYFSNPDSPEGQQDVTYASIDAPDLPTIRQRLVEALSAGGFQVATNHGFTPHMTLAYDKVPLSLDNKDVEFTQVTLAVGDDRFTFALTAPDVDDNDELDSEVAATDDDGTVYLNVGGKKKYPIKTAKDASDAYALRNNGKGVTEQQVLAHIRRACNKLGIALPAAMRSDSEKSAEIKKTKKGKHRFVSATHVHPSVYAGVGYAPSVCIACGKPDSDPDHDGDVDDATTETTTAAADDDQDAGKMAQGLDAAVDQALVLLRSTPDLPSYAAQARDLLQGVEETCDALLDYFGVADSDEPDEGDTEQSTLQRLLQEQATTVASSAALLAENVKRFAVARTVDTKLDPVPLETIKAFLTEVDGKTILTAPASTRDLGMWEKALTPNEHVLWIQGRFVGADEPNRNGAFWSSQDLERGAATVPFGPLNWLHDANKIIGCIADQRMVYPDEQAAASGLRPHIAAVSAMYRWIYPEEAAVIEMAAERGSLWYSMECISKEVGCVGDTGCGTQVSYMDYLRGNGCDHMTKRTGVRQLIDPTFLGGAVIVPPARPGWADADATLMRQAASYTEQAVEQMGTSDLPGFEIERLLAEVLRFAKVGA